MKFMVEKFAIWKRHRPIAHSTPTLHSCIHAFVHGRRTGRAHLPKPPAFRHSYATNFCFVWLPVVAPLAQMSPKASATSLSPKWKRNIKSFLQLHYSAATWQRSKTFSFWHRGCQSSLAAAANKLQGKKKQQKQTKKKLKRERNKMSSYSSQWDKMHYSNKNTIS